MTEQTSPRIRDLSWGRVEVEGQANPFKDVKLFPGGARAWDWRESGTDHVPGIQPGDVQELIDRGARVVILSRGMLGRLHVRPDTLELLRAGGIEVHVLKSPEAVAKYNELAAVGAAGALIHSTC